MVDLSRKKTLVTGASRGIGRGIAQGFAEAGAHVAINHPPDEEEREKARELSEELEGMGVDTVILEADVSDAEAVESMASVVNREWGGIDVLVNNAGTSTRCRLVDMPIELWDRIIAVNLRGVFLTTRFTLPGMLENGGGKIINIASQYGFIGAEEFTHYSAAKGGVISFTRALAREVAPEINVNAVAPGPVDVGKRSHATEEWWEERTKNLPLQRRGCIDDVVPTVMFLAGSESDYYTGQVLSPDGGDVMH